jgi:hypothetical protein
MNVIGKTKDGFMVTIFVDGFGYTIEEALKNTENSINDALELWGYKK